MRYCCGFAFDSQGRWVWLIEKKKPTWQRGMLNGIGGKIENGEMALDAMQREFREETGTDIIDWDEFLILSGRDWTVFFFKYFRHETKGPFDQLCKATTEESPVLVDTCNLPSNVIPNLHWIIPMALDRSIILPVSVTTE